MHVYIFCSYQNSGTQHKQLNYLISPSQHTRISSTVNGSGSFLKTYLVLALSLANSHESWVSQNSVLTGHGKHSV